MKDINTDIICPQCGGKNESVYNSVVLDYYCQLCGEWHNS